MSFPLSQNIKPQFFQNNFADRFETKRAMTKTRNETFGAWSSTYSLRFKSLGPWRRSCVRSRAGSKLTVSQKPRKELKSIQSAAQYGVRAAAPARRLGHVCEKVGHVCEKVKFKLNLNLNLNFFSFFFFFFS
jgi:hypothetical protein